MKILLISILTLFVTFLSQAREKPNIVLILIDDMGYADIGPFGATKQKTPELEKMAREGMKLTSFYAAPVCSVARAQLLTGSYGVRISVPSVFGPASPYGLNPEETTIAEYLKKEGYATACIGKWHVGDQPAFLPTRQGFDHYFGIPYSNDMMPVSKETGKPVVPLMRDEEVIELMEAQAQTTITARYTEEALSFIKENKDQPFFLYLPHTAVHTPIHPGENFQGKSDNGRFGDWVEELDWSTGRILETLRELGIAEETLVIFTSDNGPWLLRGKDGGSAEPLRGGKASTWEGGMRVPTIAWWPEKIEAASESDAITGLIDLLPTCIKLAGVEVPAEPVIDGVDISPVLLGKAEKTSREVQYYFLNLQLQAVRKGKWKLALFPQAEILGRPAKPDAKINPRLYDLESDISETTNLADANPEIVAMLQDLADEKSSEIGGDSPSARRPPGLVENPVTLYPSVPRGTKK